MTRQKIVTLLGSLGIIPFLIALVIGVVMPEAGLSAFSLYSLAILCFLAGSWWSTALMARDTGESQRLVILLISNAVVLAAVVLVLSEWSGGVLGLAVLYAGLMVGERKLEVFAEQPEYYRTMRSLVSVVVLLLHLSCWLLVATRL